MAGYQPPNIVFLVWDAARFDYVADHASTFNSLLDENVWFERAVTPSTWSLPAHASLFNGQYPHEHGRYRITDQQLTDLPLVTSLSEQGYHTVGVSGNGFASPKTGFHEPFDTFHYTADFGPFGDGLNVSERALEKRWEDADVTTKDLFTGILSEAARHEKPLKSLVNFGFVSLNRLAPRFSPLQHIPHPLFNPHSQYSYSPEANTERIAATIEDADDPFFIFANYMDTHRPYYPPEEVRKRHLSTELSYRRIKDLNELAAPWEFIERTEDGDDLEIEIEELRSLYAGEISSVDAHLDRIITALKAEGVYENTVLIVTSDHGENLGECDLLGNRRFGHEASVSRQLLRVPLLIAHPEFDGATISEWVSLTELYPLLTSFGGNGHLDQQSVVDTVCTDDVVLCEYPALGGTKIRERYPDVSREALDLRTTVHHVVACADEWLVLRDSRGSTLAWKDGASTEFQTAPDRLRVATEESIETLSADEDRSQLTDAEIERLEALGYM